MPGHKRWIVTTAADRPIGDIANDLREAGFAVGQVLEDIGSITGTAADAAVAKARSIRGVVDVVPDAPIDIGPPGSTDTW